MSTELTSRIESRINKDVSAQTGLTTTGAMAFSSVEQLMEFSKIMAIAQVAIPKHLRENPGACLAVAIQASEWEMSPFAVANKSYCVNDRLAYEAQLINAVILKRAPIRGRFKIEYSGEKQLRKCKVSATLLDGETVEYESPAIGDIKTQNSPLWKSDPDQQLFYFSSRSMCRRHFPDVILGVYTPDEMQEASEVDVTPRRATAARATPLDPFKSLPEPAEESAPVVEVETEAAPEDPELELLTDMLTLIADATDADTLTSYAQQSNNSFTSETNTKLCKRAIADKAKALGLKWVGTSEEGGFQA